MTVLQISLLILWSLPWKGVALWRAARRKDRWRFVLLLVVQSVGLLEIFYIFVISKPKSLPE